jgi:hypothetical protein
LLFVFISFSILLWKFLNKALEELKPIRLRRALRPLAKAVQFLRVLKARLRSVGLFSCSVPATQRGTIWIVDAHGYEKRFIVRADEKLTAFVELQRAIHEFAVSLCVLRENVHEN